MRNAKFEDKRGKSVKGLGRGSMQDHFPFGLEKRYNQIFNFETASLIYEGELKKIA